ncbi:helix-turn-helix domain-containing protein [Rudanella paleaurantiibacter]|uniref:Helix-turn-helix domain-containing protein n=1 Tax=Rudanella paleaurantiibacter TaxID=2614655 RepID=A0A7J5TXY8_9BACT|nr:helix-turn-helix domain-containing protein [Rudanella paleaurantiibacter]KAB7730003.1 helix-turn-helix domain-containing protein [Rudanella paleaurantiibacter]
MGRKRHIDLTDTEQLTLQEARKNHPKHEFRRSAQALLWNHKGWAVKTIAQALDVCSQTVSNWLTTFEQEGLVGLRRQKGQGRRPILSIVKPTHQQALTKAVAAIIKMQAASKLSCKLRWARP